MKTKASASEGKHRGARSMDHKRLRRRLSLAATGDGDAAGKRLRAGCSAEAAADPPTSPRWRLLQQSVLVVLFLRRACRCRKDAADGVSQIGRVVRGELCRCVGPILKGYS